MWNEIEKIRKVFNKKQIKEEIKQEKPKLTIKDDSHHVTLIKAFRGGKVVGHFIFNKDVNKWYYEPVKIQTGYYNFVYIENQYEEDLEIILAELKRLNNDSR